MFIPDFNFEIAGIKVQFKNRLALYKSPRLLELSIRDVLVRVQGPSKTKFVYGKGGEFHYSSYNRTSVSVRKISLIEREERRAEFATKILKMRLSLNAYDLIFKDHYFLADKKLHVLIPYLRIVFNHNLLLTFEVLEALTAINKVKSPKDGAPEKDKAKDDHFEPVYLASDDQVTDLKEDLKRIKAKHDKHDKDSKDSKDNKDSKRNPDVSQDQSKPEKNFCEHCVLRHKKSRSLTNIFIGDLGIADDTFSQTTFADLYDHELNHELGHHNSGFSIKIENIRKHASEPIGTIAWRLPFLSVTQDIGVFKKNLMVHICPSPSQDAELSGEFLSELIPLDPKKQNFFELIPSVSADENFLKHLDSSFWKYFRAQEKRIFGPSSDTDSIHGGNSIQHKKNNNSLLNDSEKLRAYVLVMRKQNCYKELLKDFELKKSDDYKINKLFFKVNEISVNLATAKDFIGILHNLNTIGYLLKWFGRFRSEFVFYEDPNGPPAGEVAKKPSGKPVQLDIKGLVSTECVRFGIQEINFGIHDKDILNFFVKNISFENLKEPTLESEKAEGEITLLKIESVGFNAKEVSKGALEGIGLLYVPTGNCLCFFLRNFSYEAHRKEQEIETKKTDVFAVVRPRTEIQIPIENNQPITKSQELETPNSGGDSPVLVSLGFHFDTHRLELVGVRISGKIGVTLSDVDIVDLLDLISKFGSLYTDENNRVMGEMENGNFDSKRFMEVDALIWKRQLELREKKLASANNAAQAKATTAAKDQAQQDPNAPQSEVYLSVTVDGVIIGLATPKLITTEMKAEETKVEEVKGEKPKAEEAKTEIKGMKAKIPEVFLKIALDTIVITNEGENGIVDPSTVTINVARVHLNPQFGKTSEMVKGKEDYDQTTTMGPKLQITLKNGKPYVLVECVQITFLNRVITELEMFQKDLKVKIKNLTDTINKKKLYPHPAPPKSKEDIFMLELELKQCDLWLQKNSDDEDGILVTTTKGRVVVMNKTQEIQFPYPLEEENYKLAGKKGRSIIDFERTEEENKLAPKQLVRVITADVSLGDTYAMYSIRHETKDSSGRKIWKDRQASFFHSSGIDVKAVAPDYDSKLGEWTFDANIDVDLSDFSLFCNLATLDEINLIVDFNLKETSKFYDFNKGSLERMNISLTGDASVVMDRFVIKPEKLPGERPGDHQQEKVQEIQMEKFPEKE